MAMSGIGAIAGVAGSLFQNYMNTQANREAREWSYRMWQKNNEYNTPSAQMARLRQAGINPALAMSNGAIGSGSSTSPPEGVEPVKYDFSPAVQGFQTAYQLSIENRKANAEIANQEANTRAQELRNQWINYQEFMDLLNKRADFAKKGKDTQFLDQQIEYKRQENAAFQERNAAEIQRIRSEAQRNEKQAHLLDLQSTYQDIVNRYAPQEKDKLLKQIDAHTSELLSAAYEHNQSGLKHAAEKALIGVDKDTKEKLMPHLIDEAEAKANEAYWNGQRSGRYFFEGELEGRSLPGGGSDYYWQYDRKNGRSRYDEPSRSYDEPSRSGHKGGIR